MNKIFKDLTKQSSHNETSKLSKLLNALPFGHFVWNGYDITAENGDIIRAERDGGDFSLVYAFWQGKETRVFYEYETDEYFCKVL